MSNVAIVIGGIQAENLYVIKELLKVIPVSRSHLYKSMKKYKVPCMWMSRRCFYLGKDVLDFLENLKNEGIEDGEEKKPSCE